jgi:hypothetical protein
MRDTFGAFTPPDRGLFGENELAQPRPKITSKSDLKDFTLCVHRDDPKDKAILLSLTGDENASHWFPRRLIEYVDTGNQTKGKRKNGQSVMLAVAEVTMPEWLAKQNGLV